jgi:hypothetical protein
MSVKALVNALLLSQDPTPYMGKRVYSRGGKKFGVVVGSRVCTLEGCGGMRLCVRWKDNQRTWPCLKGMKTRKDNNLQIR